MYIDRCGVPCNSPEYRRYQRTAAIAADTPASGVVYLRMSAGEKCAIQRWQASGSAWVLTWAWGSWDDRTTIEAWTPGDQSINVPDTDEEYFVRY